MGSTCPLSAGYSPWGSSEHTSAVAPLWLGSQGHQNSETMVEVSVGSDPALLPLLFEGQFARCPGTAVSLLLGPTHVPDSLTRCSL